jgi:hypothetical protein
MWLSKDVYQHKVEQMTAYREQLLIRVLDLQARAVFVLMAQSRPLLWKVP